MSITPVIYQLQSSFWININKQSPMIIFSHMVQIFKSIKGYFWADVIQIWELNKHSWNGRNKNNKFSIFRKMCQCLKANPCFCKWTYMHFRVHLNNPLRRDVLLCWFKACDWSVVENSVCHWIMLLNILPFSLSPFLFNYNCHTQDSTTVISRIQFEC